MESRTPTELKKCYRVVIDSLATEGRVFKRDDVITAEDAPGEIESLLHAGVIEHAKEDARKSDRNLF